MDGKQGAVPNGAYFPFASFAVKKVSPSYRGRFAPSPTGPLHFGSLVAAVGSFLDARAAGGEWRVRIEDLDPPREVPGAADAILRSLEALGLHWDGEVLYQSRRAEYYAAALERLARDGLVYPCACTRREVREQGVDGVVYPGTCRNGLPPGRTARTLRVRVDGARIAFADRLLGAFEQDLPREVGDFVLRRADGLAAYQLAVVVDDAAQGINQVVRGSDLLDSTARQIHLQRLLGLPAPAYLHLPVAAHADGSKLSKQTFAPAIDTREGAALARRVLAFLGQPLPDEALDLDELWCWSAARWDPARIPARRAIPVAPGT